MKSCLTVKLRGTADSNALLLVIIYSHKSDAKPIIRRYVLLWLQILLTIKQFTLVFSTKRLCYGVHPFVCQSVCVCNNSISNKVIFLIFLWEWRLTKMLKFLEPSGSYSGYSKCKTFKVPVLVIFNDFVFISGWHYSKSNEKIFVIIFIIIWIKNLKLLQMCSCGGLGSASALYLCIFFYFCFMSHVVLWYPLYCDR